MRHPIWPDGKVCLCWCVRLVVPLLFLAGCAVWSSAGPSATVWAHYSTVCHQAAADAVFISGQFDLDEEHAYTACMQRKGWEVRQTRGV